MKVQRTGLIIEHSGRFKASLRNPGKLSYADDIGAAKGPILNVREVYYP